MMNDPTLFQYCQKLVILSEDKSRVLLAKRINENDFNSIYSFIGGKMETSDHSLILAMKREKDEEIGQNVKLKVLAIETNNLLYKKKNGSMMILPHIAAIYISGEIRLSKEYSEYKWIDLNQLDRFEPKIENITDLTFWAKSKLESCNIKDLTEI